MKNKLEGISLSLLLLTLSSGCMQELTTLAPAKPFVVGVPVDTATITLNWSTTYQRIDGFGAYAGRTVPFFTSPMRDTIMKQLWGPEGLQLNIIRGGVLRTYPFDGVGTVTVKPAGSDIDMVPNSTAWLALTDAQKTELAQLWIFKKVKERYKVPIMFASAWTPPLYMKTNPNSENAQFFNGLNFFCCSTNFANYLAGFVKGYQREGIDLYAISPTNEPENVFADWEASYWDGPHLGEFVSNNLRPALDAQQLNTTKIIASENASWNMAAGFLMGMNTKNVDILAGHGYPEVPDLLTGSTGFNTHPVPWYSNGDNRSVWMTEASDASGVYDSTMAGGLKFAVSIHKFLAEANVNAYIYWLGMLASRNNEALICTRPDGSLEYPKEYDILGQYSRFIHAGYYRFDANITNNSLLMASAWKDPATGNFSVVLTNPYGYETHSRLNLNGFSAAAVTSFLTADNSKGHWQQGGAIKPDTRGNFSVVVPPYSVITFTGTAAGATK